MHAERARHKHGVQDMQQCNGTAVLTNRVPREGCLEVVVCQGVGDINVKPLIVLHN